MRSSEAQSLNHQIQEIEFPKENCEIQGTCALKRAWIDVIDYEISFSESPSFGTRLAAAFETENIETLTEYVWVQWIRGCKYESVQSEEEEEAIITFPIERELYGQYVPDCSQQWIIDSVDGDPVYFSAEDLHLKRHESYLWNERPGSFDHETQHFYKNRPPENPILYVTDRPGTAFFTPANRTARNLSQEFQMCLHREENVPRTIKSFFKKKPKPIHCFYWTSSWLYDFKMKKFTDSHVIHKACAEAPPIMFIKE
jgi:hypothetical protein